MRGNQVRKLDGIFAIRDSSAALTGIVNATMDTARVGGIALHKAGATVRMLDANDFGQLASPEQ